MLPIKDYESFWNWFIENEQQFRKVIRSKKNLHEGFYKVFDYALRHLFRDYHVNNLKAGKDDADTVWLHISAGYSIKAFPIIEGLMAAMPVIEGWRIVALRDPHGKQEGRYGNYLFNSETAAIYYYRNDQMPAKHNLYLTHNNSKGGSYYNCYWGARHYIETLLGEVAFSTLVDEIKAGQEQSIPAGAAKVDAAELHNFLFEQEQRQLEKYGPIYHTEPDEHDSDRIYNNFIDWNQALIEWEEKPSHPWVTHIELTFESQSYEQLREIMDRLRKSIEEQLPVQEGHLLLASVRRNEKGSIYLASKEYKKIVPVLQPLLVQSGVAFGYFINRDPYWEKATEVVENYWDQL